MNCSPSNLIALSSCFCGTSRKTLRQISAYLTCAWANDGSSPIVPLGPFTIISESNSDFGAIDPSGSTVVLAGDDLTFTATPTVGYAVYQWIVDGNVVQTGGTTFTLSSVHANHTVQVGFLIPVPVLTLSPPSVDSSVVINWTTSAVPNSFEIWKSTNANAMFPSYSLFATPIGSATSYTDTSGRSQNTYWAYKVVAVVGVNISAFSNIVTYPAIYTFDDSDAITSFSTPSGMTVIGALNCNFNSTITSISFTNVTAIEGNSQVLPYVETSIFNCPGVASFSAPSLTSILGAFMIDTDISLMSVSIPLLASIDVEIGIEHCPLLTVLSFPLLTSAAGLYFNGNNLTSVNLSSLNSCSYIDVSANPALVSISFPSLVITTPQTINISNCALSAASVNGILARCVLYVSIGGDVELSGGTNSPPTGQGIIDKATLIAAGWTVNTN